MNNEIIFKQMKVSNTQQVLDNIMKNSIINCLHAYINVNHKTVEFDINITKLQQNIFDELQKYLMLPDIERAIDTELHVPVSDNETLTVTVTPLVRDDIKTLKTPIGTTGTKIQGYFI